MGGTFKQDQLGRSAVEEGKYDRAEKMTVQRAEMQINRIIDQLERDCQCYVQAVDLSELVTTRIGDDVKVVHRSIIIDARRRAPRVGE